MCAQYHENISYKICQGVFYLREFSSKIRSLLAEIAKEFNYDPLGLPLPFNILVIASAISTGTAGEASSGLSTGWGDPLDRSGTPPCLRSPYTILTIPPKTRSIGRCLYVDINSFIYGYYNISQRVFPQNPSA
ncbi:hypothetical protein HYW87_01650 [Candidatus Roizmanbacteria bacterium]|nr:hypothetical protein [Candidatus Roizmanbacteria bacterium]